MTTTEPPDHLIKTGALGLRGSRVFAATAAFGVPWDSFQECAEELARAVLLAVADDLRAEGWDEGQVAGWDDARDEWLSNGVVNDLRQWSDTPNPYRAAPATEGER